MSAMSLSVTGGVVTFTNEHGHVFTASDVAVEPGDVTCVEFAGLGPYFVVQRDDVEVGRYPMRDSGGWHYEEMRAILTPPTPFLPPTDTEGGVET